MTAINCSATCVGNGTAGAIFDSDRCCASLSVRQPASFDDASVFGGVARALREEPGRPPSPGPYRDTDARGGSFLTARQRDPARIALVIEALGEAWARDPTMTFGQLLTRRSTGETGHG